MYFDIGANVGKWSLSNISGSLNCDKIIAVEASPNTFNKLVDNVKMYPNIICLNYAVCNSEEEYINFYESNVNTISTMNEDWLNSSNSRFYKYSKYNKIKCKTIKLDDLIDKYGLPELIKIDVEGGEFEVLKSLTKKVKLLCFEWASETNEITLLCLDYLVKLGYTKFSIQFKDDYLYRPKSYITYDEIVNILKGTKPKIDWGMIWIVEN